MDFSNHHQHGAVRLKFQLTVALTQTDEKKAPQRVDEGGKIEFGAWERGFDIKSYFQMGLLGNFCISYFDPPSFVIHPRADLPYVHSS